MHIEVEKRYRLHLFVFILLSFYLFLLTPNVFLNSFWALVASLATALHLKNIRFDYKRKREAAVFIFATFYLAFAVFGFALFAMWWYRTPFEGFVYFALGFIRAMYLSQAIFDAFTWLSNLRRSNISLSTGEYWKKWGILLAIMIPLFMLWQIAYNPIIISYDSWFFFTQWSGGQYFIHRSPVYSFLVSVAYRLAPTQPYIQWVAIAQIIASSALFVTFLMYLHKKGLAFKYALLLSAIIPLIPSVGLHAVTLWSDMATGLTVLWVTYVLLRIFNEIIINNTASKRQANANNLRESMIN